MKNRLRDPITADARGALVGVLCVAGLATAALLPVAAAAAEETPEAAFAGPETCAGCHAAEFEEWKASRHSGAYEDPFASYWKAHGSDPACLACHTTGFNAKSGAFAFPGVTCESCHGAIKPDHPGTETMNLPTDAAMCQTCHKQTYLEWQLSGHAKKNIRCFDCHSVHSTGLRQASAENQCGACHAQRLEDFTHATHHNAGLTCATCHLPASKSTGIGGTGAPGHSFFVGAETCAACHEETVHKSQKLQNLQDEVAELTSQAPLKELERLQDRVKNLEYERDAQRSRALQSVVAAMTGGLVLGGLIVAWPRRSSRDDDADDDG